MRKAVLVISQLDSQSKGRGFDPHPILDGNGFNAIAGLIPEPNAG